MLIPIAMIERRYFLYSCTLEELGSLSKYGTHMHTPTQTVFNTFIFVFCATETKG